MKLLSLKLRRQHTTSIQMLRSSTAHFQGNSNYCIQVAAPAAHLITQAQL
jgi:hypothetical protein